MITSALNMLTAWLLAWLWTPGGLDAPQHKAVMALLFVLWYLAFTLDDHRRGLKD